MGEDFEYCLTIQFVEGRSLNVIFPKNHVPAIPRIGESYYYEGTAYKISDIWWDLLAGFDECRQISVTFFCDLESSD
jgi:hypothetical protein